MKSIYIYIILLLLSVSACRKSPVSGHINITNQSIHPVVYLIEAQSFDDLLSTYRGAIIDSASLDKDGFYAFANVPEVNQEKLFLLTMQQKGEKYPNKLINDKYGAGNYVPFLYSSGRLVTISSDASDLLNNAEILDTQKGNQEILALIKHRKSLYGQHLKDLPEIDEENLMENEKSLYDFQKSLIEYAKPSDSYHLSILALRWASINKDYERIPELVEEICTRAQDIEPNHPWTDQVCSKMDDLPLSIGDAFPNFNLPMLNGDTSAILSLLGEEISIIDLWASWCAPCRKENRNTLVPLWEKYNQQGLQIIGYALDDGYSVWQSAILKDGADRWLHASHLNGDESPFLDRMRVRTIPTNYILDKNGIILAKNLHQTELADWIEKHFKQD